MLVRTTPFTRRLKTSIQYDENSYLIEVTLTCYPGCPGKLSGPPEDCYPPEPECAEVENVLVVDVENEDGDKTLIGQNVDWEIDISELTGRAFEEQADDDAVAWDDFQERKIEMMEEYGEFRE